MGSRAHLYTSLAELKKDADAVVVATATNKQTVASLDASSYTVTDLSIKQQFRGSALSSVIHLRQLGDSNRPVEGGTLVQPGKVYALFLQRFHFTPGDDTGQYVVVGAYGGMYMQNGTNNYTKLNVESADLPQTLDDASLT